MKNDTNSINIHAGSIMLHYNKVECHNNMDKLEISYKFSGHYIN